MPVPTTRPISDRRLLRDTVHERIRRAILDGTLRPGERLHDDELIAWLGVSRTPIREALAELSRRGLVEMAANRYTKVAKPSPDDVLDALRTLGVLFGGVVRLTVPSLTPAQRTSGPPWPAGTPSVQNWRWSGSTSCRRHDGPSGGRSVSGMGQNEHGGPDDGVDMTFDERREDELTRAPKSDPGDAAPRITTEDLGGGVTRIDVADTAAVRPGGGTSEETSARDA